MGRGLCAEQQVLWALSSLLCLSSVSLLPFPFLFSWGEEYMLAWVADMAISILLLWGMTVVCYRDKLRLESLPFAEQVIERKWTELIELIGIKERVASSWNEGEKKKKNLNECRNCRGMALLHTWGIGTECNRRLWVWICKWGVEDVAYFATRTSDGESMAVG